uniref:Uncharacterized protein n=1 Tax=Brassica oleracea var. oleracea TaxID=109376 RepID=A0A0D3C375_BRAOL
MENLRSSNVVLEKNSDERYIFVRTYPKGSVRLSDRLRVKRVEVSLSFSLSFSLSRNVSLSTKGDSPSPSVDLGGDVSTGDLLSATSLSLSRSLSVVLSGSLSVVLCLSLSLGGSLSLSRDGSPRGNGALLRWLFSETSPSVSLIGDVSLCHYLSLSLWFSLSLLVVLLESLLELFGSVSRWIISSKISIGGSPQIERYKDQAEDRLKVPSQKPPINENPTQFMSFQPSPDLGGSGSRAEIGEDLKQRSKWSTAEDLVLISAWLNTSKDAVVGNEQRAGTFWLRITSYYNASPKVVGLAKREQNMCTQNKCKQRTSGHSEDDVLKAAHEIFFNDYKVKFALEHVWRELRNDQKWCGTYGSTQQSSGSKRKRVREEQTFHSSSSMPSVNGENETRPVGVKAAKAATAKGKRSLVDEGKNLQHVLALKQEVNKTKLLDSLLSRTKPLTELEVALKDKLITEMGSSNTHPQMEVRKTIVCGLSAIGNIPPLPQEVHVADVTLAGVKVVEILDEEEVDVVELSSEEYMRSMGYLIRVEESEDDIEPEVRRMLKMMHKEEKKLREEKFKVLRSGIKLEEGESSRTS